MFKTITIFVLFSVLFFRRKLLRVSSEFCKSVVSTRSLASDRLCLFWGLALEPLMVSVASL